MVHRLTHIHAEWFYCTWVLLTGSFESFVLLRTSSLVLYLAGLFIPLTCLYCWILCQSFCVYCLFYIMNHFSSLLSLHLSINYLHWLVHLRQYCCQFTPSNNRLHITIVMRELTHITSFNLWVYMFLSSSLSPEWYDVDVRSHRDAERVGGQFFSQIYKLCRQLWISSNFTFDSHPVQMFVKHLFVSLYKPHTSPHQQSITHQPTTSTNMHMSTWVFIYAPMHTSCQTCSFWLQTGKLGGVAVPL